MKISSSCFIQIQKAYYNLSKKNPVVQLDFDLNNMFESKSISMYSLIVNTGKDYTFWIWISHK